MKGEATPKEVLEFTRICQELGYTTIVFGETGWSKEPWNIRNDSVYVRPKIEKSQPLFWGKACRILGGVNCGNGHQAFLGKTIPKTFIGEFNGTDITQQLIVRELDQCVKEER